LANKSGHLMCYKNRTSVCVIDTVLWERCCGNFKGKPRLASAGVVNLRRIHGGGISAIFNSLELRMRLK
ncbi:MAG: hypothetical protein O2967_14315, partial [Proteobacteria bacterium]|nr:hypothetical protein [Pseudomonadota bacterium]